MRGITIGVVNNITLYDSDFQTNVLDVAQAAGYAIPPYRTRMSLNQLMKDMKDIGFYQIQDTLANFALGIPGYEEFRMIDWKKTGNVYTHNGGLIFRINGVEGNGVDAYVNTNFNPSTMGVNYIINNAGISVYTFTKSTTGFNAILGHSNSQLTYIRNRLGQRINRNFVYDLIFNNSGLLILNRNGTTIDTVENDLHNVIDDTYPGVEIANENFYIHRFQNNFGNSLIGFSSIGGFVPYEVSQSFRTIYNQFIVRMNINPIA